MTEAKYTALQVAKYFIHKSNEEKDDDRHQVTNLKLQKILYYAQGWYLANYDDPLFKDSIEAWKFGPAIRSIYGAFAKYGSTPINDEIIDPQDIGAITEQDRIFLDAVWSIYREYSGSELIDSTHSEKPWREARIEIQEGESSSNEISVPSIRQYFKSLKES